MNYYKDETCEVFAYDDEQVAAGLADGKTPMAPEEVEAHVNPPLPPITREQVEALRLTAYANPVTGSDRYFAEAARMSAMGEAGADAVTTAGAARYQQIQAEYPWPAEVQPL